MQVVVMLVFILIIPFWAVSKLVFILYWCLLSLLAFFSLLVTLHHEKGYHNEQALTWVVGKGDKKRKRHDVDGQGEPPMHANFF